MEGERDGNALRAICGSDARAVFDMETEVRPAATMSAAALVTTGMHIWVYL